MGTTAGYTMARHAAQSVEKGRARSQEEGVLMADCEGVRVLLYREVVNVVYLPKEIADTADVEGHIDTDYVCQYLDKVDGWPNIIDGQDVSIDAVVIGEEGP